MTLNGVMAVILRDFTEFGSFGANYVKVVEDWLQGASLEGDRRLPLNSVNEDAFSRWCVAFDALLGSDIRYMSSSVRLSSVTFVRPT